MTAKRRLAIYRAWLVVNVMLATFLLLLTPQALYTRGMHDPAVVLPAVGALIAWWLTFIAAWIAGTRLPRSIR